MAQKFDDFKIYYGSENVYFTTARHIGEALEIFQEEMQWEELPRITAIFKSAELENGSFSAWVSIPIPQHAYSLKK